MTSYPFKSVGLALWPTPSSLEYQCYMRGGAATAGDLLMQDYLASDAATSTAGAANVRLSTHITANVIAPSAAGILTDVGPFFGLAVRSVADDALVRLCMFGYASAFVIAASGSLAIGSSLVGTTAKNLDLVDAVGERHLAQSQAVVTTPTTRELGEVGFNGIGHLWTGVNVGT